MRPTHVFLLALLLSLFMHGVYWRHLDDSPDQQSWIKEMKQFHDNSLGSGRTSLYYGYPATTLLSASSLLATVGIPATSAFAGIMTVGISVPVACSVLICYVLRPKSYWYVGVGGIMIASQLYYASTPPSAIVTPLCTLMMLYALYIYERKRDDAVSSIIFGSIAGVAMATRLDISLVVLFFLCVFLFSTIKKHVATVLFFACVVFVLCNPYMRAFPLQHLQDIVDKISYHTTLGRSTVFPSRQILLSIPLCVMGGIASILLVFFPNRYIYSIPRRFLVVIGILSVSMLVGLPLFSTYYPVWYFFPVLQIFEVLFVLYLLDALAVIGRRLFIWPLLTVLLLGNTVVFFTKLFL